MQTTDIPLSVRNRYISEKKTKARPKLEECCAQPQPSKGKTTTGGSLCIRGVHSLHE